MSVGEKKYAAKLEDIQEQYWVQKKHSYNPNTGFRAKGWCRKLDISRQNEYKKEKLKLKIERALKSRLDVDNPKLVAKWESQLASM